MQVTNILACLGLLAASCHTDRPEGPAPTPKPSIAAPGPLSAQPVTPSASAPAAPAKKSPVGDQCGKPTQELNEHAGWSTALGRYLYFHSSNTIRSLYRFDTESRTWEVLPGVRDRRFFNLLADKGRLLAVGGIAPQEETEDGPAPPVNSIEAFDFDTCTWREIGALPPGPPYRVATILHDSLYLFGGYGPGGKPERGVSVVLLAGDKQETRKQMPKLNGRVKDAVVVGERIYLLGDSNAVHIYDPKTDSWTRGANSRGYGTAADNLFVAHRNRVLSFPHTWGPIDAIAYDPSENTWADLQPLPNLSDKAGDRVFAAEVVGGELYVAALQSRPRRTVVFRHDTMSGGWTAVL